MSAAMVIMTPAEAALAPLGATYDITGTLLVRDNDTAITGDLSNEDDILVQWLDPAWVSENGDTARLALSLSQAPGATITLALGLSDSSEASLSTSSLTFTPANGTTPQIVTVTGLDDTPKIQMRIDLTFTHPHDRAVHIDIFTTGKLRVETCTNL